MSEYILLMSTAPSEEEAEKLGKGMVEKGLIACVNILPKIRSVYKWKGKMCDEEEVLIIMKSRKERFKEIVEYINHHHSYDVPEIISLSISAGSKEYLAWIDEICG